MSIVNDSEEKNISITKAARMHNITRQAIYVAIKLKKLKAQKGGSRWYINIDDLNEYRKTKYCRSKSKHNGKLIFNNEEGFYSIKQAAKILKIPAQKIYYATRIGTMKTIRKGAALVVHSNDIEAYRKQFLKTNTG